MVVMPYKNLKRAALVAIGLLGPSLSVQAVFLDFLKKNPQASVSAIQENVKEAKAYIPIPGFGSIGGGLSSKVTDMAFHTQLAEQLWRGVREDLKKKENLSDEEVSYLQGLEQQFREMLIARFQQVPASQIESLAQSASPEIARAQLTVQEMLATLKALREEVSGGDQKKQAKALQAMSDLIEVAQTELIQIQQVDQGDQATLAAKEESKQEWQVFVQAGYQQYLQEQQPAVWAQQLRVQALSKQATAEDWYDYGNHLLTYNLCPPTDETIINALLQAAQSGYEPATSKLLAIYKPQVKCACMGEVYFRLFQLQVNEQSPFVQEVRIHFLARALIAGSRPALVYLDRQIREDIEKGVRRKNSDGRWQQWLALRGQLEDLTTTNQREIAALIEDVDGMYKAKNAKRKLKRLQEIESVSCSDSDSDSETPSPSAQVKALEEAQAQVSREKEALASALATSQQQQMDTAQKIERLQTELESTRSAKEEIEARLQALNSAHQAYRLERQQSGELKAEAMATLNREKDALIQTLATKEAEYQSYCTKRRELGIKRERDFKEKFQAQEREMNCLKEELASHQADRLARQESGELKEQIIEQLQTGLESMCRAKEETEARLEALNSEHEAYRLERLQTAELTAEMMMALTLETSQQQQTDKAQEIATLREQLDQLQMGKAELMSYLSLEETKLMSHLSLEEAKLVCDLSLEEVQQLFELTMYSLCGHLAQLQVKKAEKAFQLGRAGDPGFGVATVPEGCLPSDFSKLPGSEEIDSDEYGNYRHKIAGVHVWIPAFVYRVGESAAATLFQQYGAHALEVLDLGVYLACFDVATRAGLIARLAQGQQGPGSWQLHRAFVNAGAVQAGFFMQKYLASKHENGRSVTSVAQTVPLSLTHWDGYTRSKDMPGCAGRYGDVYVLAKQTSDVHQVASIFQYSALTMLSLAQAQGAGSNQYCAWWSADAKGCCPKGCARDLHDEQKVNVVWQSAGEPDDANKPLTGSCSDPAWASHNGQGNGVMDIKGALWEVAGAVTTGSDTDNPRILYALARQMDYIALNVNTAFGTTAQLQARGDVPACLSYRVGGRLDGTFPLFSGDGAYDALALPKSVDAKGLVWPGYDHSLLYTKITPANLMPLVGGCWWDGAEAGLCARAWLYTWRAHSDDAGFRLAAYGLTWAQLAQASGE